MEEVHVVVEIHVPLLLRKGVGWFLCGLLQQDFSLMVLHKYYRREMIGAVFDVGRVSRFQCGLLHENFSLIVLRRCYKRRRFVQSLVRKRVSQIQCGFLHQDYFLTVLHRCHKRRKGSREEGGCENPCVTR